MRFLKSIESFISGLIYNINIIFILGFLLLFLGRNLSSEIFALFFYSLSILFFLLPCVLFIFSKKSKQVYVGNIRKSIWLIFGLGFTCILFYILQLDVLWGNLIFNDESNKFIQSLKGLQKFFQISYLTLLFGLFILSVLFQSSLKAIFSESAKALEIRDIAIHMIILFAVLVSLNYAAKLRPVSIDLTTLGKYSLSDEGKKIIEGIDKKVVVTGFYPFFHDLYREVELMLNSISSVNPLIQFSLVDALREKDIANSKTVDQNGYVVFESINSSEFAIDKRHTTKRVRIERPSDLKKMEKEFISAILNVIRERKKIYFTAGHGEVLGEGKFKESLISLFQEELKNQNYEISRLNVKSGFPPDIPVDADAVVIMGAKKSFIDLEKEALINYIFKRGGKVFLCLDPTLFSDFSFLLEPFKIKYNQKNLLSMSALKDKPDILIVDNYTAHPITNSFLDLVSRKKFSIFPSSGSFEQNDSVTKDKNFLLESDYKTSYIVKTNSNTWVDSIKNFVYDKSKELKKVRNLALSIEQKNASKSSPFRLVAFADVDFIRNKYIAWPGKHSILAINSLKWLLEDENIMGILPKEIEAGKIKLTEKEDDFVFYSLVLIWPFLIFILGYLYIHRQNKSLITSSEVKV